MNKHLKLITALLSIILCMAVCTLNVSAVDSDGDGYDDETGEYIGVVTEPVYTDPVYEETTPIETEPEYSEPVDETEPEYTDPDYTEPEYTDPEYTDPTYDYQDVTTDDSYDDTQSNGSYNDYDFDTEYDIDYSSDSYVAPSTSTLYDSDRVIDDSELSKSDWDYIKANLNNADASDDDGSDDFNFIKKNDSKGDNGDWMLIVGVGCILLSIAGITYVIASAVIRRKKIKSGAYATATSSRYRSNDDYGDDYKTSRSEKKKLDKSRRYDTADVVLPKSRNKNGRRYK